MKMVIGKRLIFEIEFSENPINSQIQEIMKYPDWKRYRGGLWDVRYSNVRITKNIASIRQNVAEKMNFTFPWASGSFLHR